MVEGTIVPVEWYCTGVYTHITDYRAGLPVPGSLNINSTTLHVQQ